MYVCMYVYIYLSIYLLKLGFIARGYDPKSFEHEIYKSQEMKLLCLQKRKKNQIVSPC